MSERKSLRATVIKVVVLLMLLVSQALIVVSSFSPIVIGRDENKVPILGNNNMAIVNILTIMSLVIIILVILKSIIVYLDDNINTKGIKIIEIAILLFVVGVNIYTLVLYPVDQDKRNLFSFGFSLANIIIAGSIIMLEIYLLVSTKSTKNELTIDVITEASVMAALAIVFSLISKIIPGLELPNGGSFSLSMLPLFIFALRRGAVPGFLMGLVYGVVNMITDGGTIIHLGVPFFDYLLPFSLLAGVSGLFSKKAQEGHLGAVVAAVLIGGFIRYVFHGFSGVLFFSEYAGDNNAWFYSFILYNLPYMTVSIIGTLVVTLMLRRQLIVADTRIR